MGTTKLRDEKALEVTTAPAEAAGAGSCGHGPGTVATGEALRISQ